MTTRLQKITKKADRTKKRYGKTMTQKNQTPIKPEWKIRPKGTNPLKKKWGFHGAGKW